MEKLEIYKQLRVNVYETLNRNPEMNNHDAMAYIESLVFREAKYLIAREKRFMIERLFNSFRGLDVIQSLVDDDTISEIMINRYDEIYIERFGNITKTDIRFDDTQKFEDLIQMIVSKMNRSVNERTPIVDARWDHHLRINVVLPPISLNGPVMTIRKFPKQSLGFQDLLKNGGINEAAAQLMSKLVQSRSNILISGGTSSGKTTFLNALTDCIHNSERIITIEDCAELNIQTIPNVVRLETRNVNVDGKGEVSISDLIRTSLRMRPDRIIVGEVRGAEAFYMLQAMNTGHDGSICTAHANSSLDMLTRLETMVLSGIDFPLQAVRQMICSAIDIIVHMKQWEGRRVVAEICEVAGIESDEIQLNPLFVWNDGTLLATGSSLKKQRNSNLYAG
jgi:pilus assembly protein CpaF